jgi:hypothetical protein
MLEQQQEEAELEVYRKQKEEEFNEGKKEF